MARKVIHTPDLLAAKFGLTPPINDATEPALQVKYKTVTSEGVKREKLVEKQVNKEVQLGGLATPKPPPPTPSPDPTPSPTGYNGTYDTDFTFETRPSKFEIKERWYNRSSRKGKVPKGKQRDISSIRYIFLHHTGTKGLNDKGKAVFNSWRIKSSSAHAVMDGAGHIEYTIPIRYVANTQGVIYNDPKKKYSRSNICGLSIEIANLGFFTTSEVRNGITYWGRDGGKDKIPKKDWVPESETSLHYDYNLNPIKKYKGKERSATYSQAQMDALAGWIKEMLKVTGITWKFTEETYKAMFPNRQVTTQTRNKLKKAGSGKIKVKDTIFAAYTQISRSSPFSLPWWGVSEDFYNSKKGVYTHNSAVPEKTDICPTYNMIKMLKDNFS